MIDVTDTTFQDEVIDKSNDVPVVVDLWAPWCGPCRTLGPILEKVVGATEGKVVLAKVNVDDNQQISSAFQVQGIPAVYALKGGKVVDGFVGAQGEAAVQEFVDRLLPSAEDEQLSQLISAGDEASLRQALELDPDNVDAVSALAALLLDADDPTGALEVLARIPETAETRQLAARARTGGAPSDDVGPQLDDLLERVRDDEEARQQYVDLLDVLGPDDPRTADYRKALTAKLF
jgi:putative thioredoxin